MMHDTKQVLYIGIFGAAAFVTACAMSAGNGIGMGFVAGLTIAITVLLADCALPGRRLILYNGTHEV